MNYINLVDRIKNVSESTKFVNSICSGDVYENWNSAEIKYGSINIGLENVERGENTITYNVILYYGDRMLQDKSNREQIWSNGVNVLQSILNGIDDDDVTVGLPIQYIPFEQKFADFLAGVYANVRIVCDFELGSCEIDKMYYEPKIIEIFGNGRYNVSDYDLAIVNCIGEAPLTGKQYGRQNGEWTEIVEQDLSDYATKEWVESKGYVTVETLTQAEYDALEVKEHNKIYLIEG